MAINVRWYGPQVIEKTEVDIKKRMIAAAILVANHAKTLISEPYPPVSMPGEPPHRRTGRLRASVAWDVGITDHLYAKVGTNIRYGKYLELGTSRMAARPWLRRAMIEKTPEIRRILGQV